jgi:hypothetical protein
MLLTKLKPVWAGEILVRNLDTGETLAAKHVLRSVSTLAVAGISEYIDILYTRAEQRQYIYIYIHIHNTYIMHGYMHHIDTDVDVHVLSSVNISTYIYTYIIHTLCMDTCII